MDRKLLLSRRLIKVFWVSRPPLRDRQPCPPGCLGVLVMDGSREDDVSCKMDGCFVLGQDASRLIAIHLHLGRQGNHRETTVKQPRNKRVIIAEDR